MNDRSAQLKLVTSIKSHDQGLPSMIVDHVAPNMSNKAIEIVINHPRTALINSSRDKESITWVTLIALKLSVNAAVINSAYGAAVVKASGVTNKEALNKYDGESWIRCAVTIKPVTTKRKTILSLSMVYF